MAQPITVESTLMQIQYNFFPLTDWIMLQNCMVDLYFMEKFYAAEGRVPRACPGESILQTKITG